MFTKFLFLLAIILNYSQKNKCQITVKDTVPIYKRFIAEGIVPHVIDSPPNYTATVKNKDFVTKQRIISPNTTFSPDPSANSDSARNFNTFRHVTHPCSEVLPHVEFLSSHHPQLLRQFSTFSESGRVTYQNGLKFHAESKYKISFPYDVKVFPGVILNILEVETKPRPRWRAIDDATYYTVIMISPDLPQHNVPYAEWNPWIIRNIPGLKVARGQTVIPYNMPSEARRDAIFYMYVFLIYKQKEFITYNDSYYEDYKMIEKGEFRVKRYTEIYNLTAPEAGNYYVLTFYQPPAEVETTRSTLHFEW